MTPSSLQSLRLKRLNWYSLSLAASGLLMGFTGPLNRVSWCQEREIVEQRQEQAREKSRQSSDQPSEDRGTRSRTDRRSSMEEPSLGILARRCPGNAVCIKAMMPNSPADDAGLEEGDYILSLNGQEVRSPEELRQRVKESKAGTEVELRVWRDGQEMEKKVFLASISEQLPKSHDAWLGVMLGAGDQNTGVTINQIIPGSPAAESDLEEGDQVIKIDGHDIADVQTFVSQVEATEPGNEVKMTIRRDGQEKELTVKIGSLGDAPMSILRQAISSNFGDHWPNSIEMNGGNNELVDRAIDDLRRQIRELRKEVAELREGKTPGNALPKKRSGENDVGLLLPPVLSNLALVGQQNRWTTPYYRNRYNNGYYRNNYYGNFRNDNQFMPYPNNGDFYWQQPYYYRYRGVPYYYNGGSNWYGYPQRPSIQLTPNLGLYFY